MQLVKGLTWVLGCLIVLTLILCWELWVLIDFTSTHINCSPNGTGT